EPALNGFSKEISDERNGKGEWKLLFTTKIETERLEVLLDNYLPLGQSIDFLTIDVEGFDYEVLLSNNFQKYKPILILVEIYSNCFDDLLDNRITNLLQKEGYKIYAKTVNTVFYINSSYIIKK
uniref:FkbM family methyltransferase n=1 Tax=Flavobacterium sp. TaxID=239 RepID=UPI00404B1AC1